MRFRHLGSNKPEIDMSVHTHGVPSDGELVAQARAGRREAFEELIGRHYRTCVNVATLMLHDRDGAQDEVQNACWKAFIHLDQYQGEAAFSTWLLSIVENQCRMIIRIRKRVSLLHLDTERSKEINRRIELSALGDGPEDEVISGEFRDLLQREIRRIPPIFQSVLLLRDVHELPMTEVAEHLKITVQAAKSRLFRARRELKARVIRQCGNGWLNRSVPKSQRLSLASRGKWMS